MIRRWASPAGPLPFHADPGKAICPTIHATRTTPPERLLFPACTCWELGGHDLVGQVCGPPSPSPEGTAIPSAGTIPSGLPCRSSGLAQEQDMSSMHTDRILPPCGATATNLCQSCTSRYCRQGMCRGWPFGRSSSRPARRFESPVSPGTSRSIQSSSQPSKWLCLIYVGCLNSI